MRRIKAAAIIYQGVTYAQPAPARHHHVIRFICSELGIDSIGENEQGFVDEDGHFLDRTEALEVARAAGQLLPNVNVYSQLYSENLW